MLKMSVSPLAIRNSSMPYSTPFRVETTMRSSTGPARLSSMAPHGRGVGRTVASLSLARALHLAGGRHNRVPGVDLAQHLPAPAGLLLVERLLRRQGAERADVHRLEELVIVLAHEALAAVEDLRLHAFELGRDLDRLAGLGLA